MKHASREKNPPAYISEEDFNQMTQGKAPPPPWKDSRGDSAYDEMAEITLGRDFAEDESVLERDPIVADHHSGGSAQSRGSEDDIDENVGVRSSERPDPRADRDSDTSTH